MVTEYPFSINWNFTDACNFNCLHCYSRGRKPVLNLSIQEMFFVTENIIKANTSIVNFGGGEPLLEMDRLLQIIKRFSESNISTFLSSNAWIIDEMVLDKLEQVGLTGIYISLDSLRALVHDGIRCKNGSLEKVFKVIEMLRNRGIKLCISTVISKKNYTEIKEIVKYCVDNNCQSISLKRFRPQGNGRKEQNNFSLSEAEEEKMKLIVNETKKEYGKKIEFGFVYSDFPDSFKGEGCPCGRTSLGLMPNADVKMCVYGQTVIGNLLKDDLLDLWQNHPYLKKNRIHHICEGLL